MNICQCKTVTLVATTGHIVSPNYPNNYSSTAQPCKAKIVFSSNLHINIYVLDFDLPYNSEASLKCKDQLVIKEGGAEKKSFCVADWLRRGERIYTSSGSVVTLEFTAASNTDGQEHKGFWLYYEGKP